MFGEVLVAVVDGFKLAAIDCHDRFREQLQVPAQHNELTTDAAYSGSVVLAKIGDGLEVRSQSAREPDQFKIAFRLAFQASARLQAIEVAVDVNLEQRGGVVGGTARGTCRGAFKTELDQVQFFDEYINDANRVVVADIVIKTLRKQRGLRSTFRRNEALHQGDLATLNQ